MTNGVTNPNKRTLRVILAAAAVLILCGAFCGAAAADNPVTEQELRAAIADSAQSTVTLGADITLTTGTLTISRTVTLDLNGKTLARSSAGATPKFSVITINSGGNLTLTDSSSQGTGKITGGNTDYGGGVFIGGSGIFNLYSGSITGNSAVSDGGGVFIDAFGTINLYSGSITGNIGKYNGGIYVYSTEGVVNLMGGEPVIRENTMKTDIEVSENNIRLYDSDTISLKGKLTGNADVRITYPYPKEGTIFGSVGTGGGGAEHIKSDGGGLCCAVTDTGRLIWCAGASHMHDGVTFQPWADGGNLPASGSYYLETDVLLTKSCTLNGDLNLCLNGHVIRMDGKETVIQVNGGYTLNIYNSDSENKVHYFTISKSHNLWNLDDTKTGAQGLKVSPPTHS